MRFNIFRRKKRPSIPDLYYNEVWDEEKGLTLLDMIEKHSKQSYTVEDIYLWEFKRLEDLWKRAEIVASGNK